MKIPSRDVWSREEFLAARKRQMQQPFVPPPGFEKAERIVMDPGDEVICDSCNAAIEDPYVQLVQFGRRVVCAECFTKWYASEPLEYRELNPDGSIGRKVE